MLNLIVIGLCFCFGLCISYLVITYISRVKHTKSTTIPTPQETVVKKSVTGLNTYTYPKTYPFVFTTNKELYVFPEIDATYAKINLPQELVSYFNQMALLWTEGPPTIKPLASYTPTKITKTIPKHKQALFLMEDEIDASPKSKLFYLNYN